MKKNILCILLFVSSFNLFSSPRMLPCFPEKYERWINHYHSKSESYQIDFCNYEMSTLPHYSGEDGYESWFVYSVSKNLKKNRKKLNENVALCFDLSWDKGYLVSELSAAVKSLTLVYDDCEINLYDKLQKWDYYDRENYSSIYGLALLENSLFQKITAAKELYFEYVLDGVVYRIPLQVPVLEDLPTKKDYSLPDFTLTKIKEENETITYKYEYKSDLASVGYVKYGCYEGILEVITKKDSLVPVMNIIEKRESTFGPRLLLEKMNDDGKNLYLKYYIEPYGQKAAGFGYIEVFFTIKDDSYQIADYNCNIESHFSFDEESGAEYPDPDGTIVYHKDLSQEEFLNILFDKSLGF